VLDLCAAVSAVCLAPRRIAQRQMLALPRALISPNHWLEAAHPPSPARIQSVIDDSRANTSAVGKLGKPRDSQSQPQHPAPSSHPLRSCPVSISQRFLGLVVLWATHPRSVQPTFYLPTTITSYVPPPPNTRTSCHCQIDSSVCWQRAAQLAPAVSLGTCARARLLLGPG